MNINKHDLLIFVLNFDSSADCEFAGNHQLNSQLLGLQTAISQSKSRKRATVGKTTIHLKMKPGNCNFYTFINFDFF